MKFIYSILFILATCFYVNAQKGILKGTVLDDKTGEPMMSATLFIKETKQGIATDFDGNYKFELEPGLYSVVYKFVGYEEKEEKIEIKAGTTIVKDVKLNETPQETGLVVITGTKYEKDISEQVVSMEVMKLSTIQNSNSKMTESLNKVPGVNMIGNNISIRGGAGFSDGANTRVMMLLDDLPLVGSDNGSIKWDALPLESVEQMEVIKGASSALYGTSAMNGVINIRTGNPKSDKPYTKIITNFGGYQAPKIKGYSRWWKTDQHTPMFGGMSIVHRRKFKWFDLSFGANYQQDQSYLKFNDTKKFRFNIKLRKVFTGKLEGLTIGINTTYSHESGHQYFTWSSYKRTVDPSTNQVTNFVDSLIYFPFAKDPFLDRNINIDPYITYYNKHGDRHALKFRIFNSKHYDQEVKNSNLDPFAIPKYETTGTALFSNSTQAYGEYSYVRQFDKIDVNVTTGLTGTYSNIKSITYNGNHFTANAGVYIQAEKKFFKKLTLSAGVRAEFSKTDTIIAKKNISFSDKKVINSPIVPVFRLGLNYQASRGTFIRASFGMAYRFPTAAELFILTSRAGGRVFPNPNLAPEDGWSSEIGVKQAVKIKNWFAYFDIAGYYTKYRNMIEYKLGTFIPPGGTTPAYGAQAQNVTKATIFGTELSAYGQGKLFGIPFNFIVGYSFTLPYQSDTLKNAFKEHRSLTNMDAPILDYRNIHSFKSDIEATYKGISLGVSLVFNSYTNRIPASASGFAPGIIDYRKLHNKGSFLFDMRLAYSINDKAKISFIAKNLLNNEYMLRAGFLEAPRNYAMQVSYEF
ncbi:MAG: TonB-dependent receptor [Bacteroidota bacterium]